MRKFLRSLYIVGIVVFILDYFGHSFDPDTVMLLMVLLPLTIITLKYVNSIEDPEKHKAMIARFTIVLPNTDEEAKTVAANSSYNSEKKSFPIVISIVTLVIVGYAIFRIIDKANRGMFVFSRLTFILGIILIATMTIILIISLKKKEHLFAKENIRKNAYIYLNAIIGLMLIAK